MVDEKQFIEAFNELEIKSGISKDAILNALKEALDKGLKKQLGGDDAYTEVKIDSENGKISLSQLKKVVAGEEEDDFRFTEKKMCCHQLHTKLMLSYLLPADSESFLFLIFILGILRHLCRSCQMVNPGYAAIDFHLLRLFRYLTAETAVTLMSTTVGDISHIILFFLIREVKTRTMHIRASRNIAFARNRSRSYYNAKVKTEACFIDNRSPCIENTVPGTETYIVI